MYSFDELVELYKRDPEAAEAYRHNLIDRKRRTIKRAKATVSSGWNWQDCDWGQVRPGQTQIQPGPYNGQTRRHFGSCDYGSVYGDESGEDTLRWPIFFIAHMAEALGCPSRVLQLRTEITLAAESSYQNTMARNNKMLKVNYSASPESTLKTRH